MIPLEPGQPAPDPIPADPDGVRFPLLGPPVRCEVRKPRKFLPGHAIFAVGTVFELRESQALHQEHLGHVKILDRLTAVGAEVRDAFKKGPFTPDYAAHVKRHRRRSQATPSAEGVRCKVLASGMIDGQHRRRGE